MINTRKNHRRRNRLLRHISLVGAACMLFHAYTASAACRVSDFTNLDLSSLSEVQRLSYVEQMTLTEYQKYRQVNPGDPNFYSPLASSADLADAQQKARTALSSLHTQTAMHGKPYRHSDSYSAFWANDFLTDEQMRDFVSCSSRRRPGLVYAGRLSDQGTFNFTFAHLTPVGVEKIRIQLVASRNIKNSRDFETYLNNLGERDNFAAETFSLQLEKPNEEAAVVLRAGWETPMILMIPPYPYPELPTAAEAEHKIPATSPIH